MLIYFSFLLGEGGEIVCFFFYGCSAEFPENITNSSRGMEAVARRKEESLSVGLSVECLEGVESMANLYDSKLEKFSKFLGMPVHGFENKILLLLKRMEARRSSRGLTLGSKRKFRPDKNRYRAQRSWRVQSITKGLQARKSGKIGWELVPVRK